MRHKNKQKFGTGKDHRRKLMRSLATSVILHEKVETTSVQAKVVRSYVEKLITRAKNSSLHNRRVLLTKVSSNATAKLLEVLGPKYSERQGGYIRLTKLAPSTANKSRVLVELVE